MNNKRGFTLVELLAVIVILAVILVIAIPNVIKVIDKAKLDTYKRNEDMLVSATQKYMASNGISLNVGETTTINYSQLQNDKLIDKITDQTSKGECSNSKIYVTKTSSGYTYKPGLVCDNYISLDTFNFITNGNFVGTTNWSGSGSTISAVDNKLMVTGTTSAGPAVIQYTPINVVPTQQIYLNAKVTITNSECNSISLYTYETIVVKVAKTINNPINNVAYNISGIATQTNSGPLRVYLRNYYNDIATATGKVMEIKDVIAIDMGTDSSNPFYGKSVDYMDNLINKSR
jgi:prepilin-type N-terminal cleavage/methylation domain-containing protein